MAGAMQYGSELIKGAITGLDDTARLADLRMEYRDRQRREATANAINTAGSGIGVGAIALAKMKKAGILHDIF